MKRSFSEGASLLLAVHTVSKGWSEYMTITLDLQVGKVVRRVRGGSSRFKLQFPEYVAGSTPLKQRGRPRYTPLRSLAGPMNEKT